VAGAALGVCALALNPRAVPKPINSDHTVRRCDFFICLRPEYPWTGQGASVRKVSARFAVPPEVVGGVLILVRWQSGGTALGRAGENPSPLTGCRRFRTRSRACGIVSFKHTALPGLTNNFELHGGIRLAVFPV